MSRTSTNVMGTLLLAAALTGCATSKEELLSHGSATMLDIWNRNTGGEIGGGPAARQLRDARQALRRPLTTAESQASCANTETYTRTAYNEIHAQFRRLPNPDLVMYVFAHLAGTDPVPIPGYSTVFPLYQRVQYAMPGERTANY